MMDFEWKPSVETVLRCISTFSGLKITKAQWDHKHSSVPKWNFDKVKNQQTIILLIPSKIGKTRKTSWICVAFPLIQRRPPPPLALPPQPQCNPLYLLNPKENIRNSSWLPKLVVHRSGFSPVWETKCSLRSEWQRAENWLLPTMCWKVKGEKWKWWNCGKIKPNSGESNGSFRLMAWTPIPSVDWAADFWCWVPSAQRSPTWWSNPSPAGAASPPCNCL